MSRDERLLMIAHGSATVGELMIGMGHLIGSSDARATYRRYVAVSAVLRAAIGGEDEIYRIDLRRRLKPTKWALLVLLVGIALVEWGTYSGPALMDAIKVLGKKCGF